MKEYNKRIYEQAEQFGIENRMLQCSEEAGELIQALCKYQRILNADKTCNTDMVHAEYMIAEEIADIEICFTYFCSAHYSPTFSANTEQFPCPSSCINLIPAYSSVRSIISDIFTTPPVNASYKFKQSSTNFGMRFLADFFQ